MLKLAIACLLTLTGTLSLARLTDGQVKHQLDSKQNPKELTITTKKGFHLNIEAPTGIFFDHQRALFQPTTKTESKFVFEVPDKVKKAEASFFVCDDKKTVCEKHVLQVNLREGSTTTMMNEASTLAPVIINEKSKTPRLLAFTAPWCPACIRMESETYNQKTFKDLTNKIKFEKLNIDLTENHSLSDQYKIQAIPTLVLVNEDGLEISRWTDYKVANLLVAEIQSSLKTKALVNTSSQNQALAMKVYKAEDDANADKKNIPEYVNALTSAMILTTSESDQTQYFLDWAKYKKQENQLTIEVKTKIDSTIKKLMALSKSPRQAKAFYENSGFDSATDFEQEAILVLKSEFHQLIDENEKKSDTDKQLLSSLQKRKLSVEKPGQILQANQFYTKLKRNDLIEKNLKSLIAKYPKTYVYYSKISGFYSRNKNNDDALNYINKALEYPEGNEPQLRLSKAKILKEMNNKSEAKIELEKILANKEINHPKYKRLVTQIKELQEQIK